MDTPAPASPLPPRYPVAIIGAGALGLSFAARLAQAGNTAVIARDGERARSLRRGIPVGGRLLRLDVFGAEETPEADWVIVLVKTGDTAAAAATAMAMRPKGVLSLQNGLVEALLPTAGPALTVGQGVTTEGAYRDAHGVHPSGAGETLLPPGFETLAALLVAAGFVARIEPDIAQARLAKLLVNAAINPLAALFRVPNGALLNPPHRLLLDTLVREALPVLQAHGLALDEAAALARVHGVATATAGNRASMLQDILAGRRTEIDAITGVLLRMPTPAGVALPTHQALHTLVRTIEQAAPDSRGG
ncbi:ketopantoate reductase family protein [Thauera linaloolentis]|uniref:2-dehydropantoate 2-reductase n=1 Tax=Thauera linaloolentis (strain DSM 12138 / JCM 21573 / CCUG 41526 / CIP 105981 / IAM 15112 / NBRC 102519 / 47Lol) TaxID=1123367 RepID=N6YQ94_THAL4|nr:2-dehydropantoate 2-reductase [Thauera linaloolentis]ENO84567.1 2-dehydropantoate 2-reductase [Thauera linaloolentis 47Lol = DSM 12138]MCM8563976.1 2-dehydropantoate 2-reductase [Thauera linaloolentis]